MDWQTLLITVFVYISEKYKTQLWPFCQRMSNNNNPQFSDEELLTIFIYGVMKKRFELKDIYNYANNHLREWFPKLPSYVAFVQRLNRFDSLFPMLIELILNDFSESDLIPHIQLIDSMPIILAKAKRSAKAKVANQVANKGYCASKDGNLETLSMVMLDYDFDGEVFDLDEVFYAEELKKNGYEVRFAEDKVKERIMVIYIDIFGNEKREIKKLSDFNG
ncbi:MAG: hypothetical protein K6U11_02600 [bacterium]|nr:hypothetical protein [bacterium]